MLIDILDNIFIEDNQIKLIRMIESGEITFSKKKPGFYQFHILKMFCSEYWISCDGSIKLWFEYASFGCFTYLTINNGTDISDKIKYGSELALTIQNPNGNYLNNKLFQ